MSMRLKPLREQTIVITGASSGIGLATARLAARRGARLVLAARSEKALRQLESELHTQRVEAIHVIADVGDAEAVRRIGEEGVRAFGGIDTWINNAAGSVYGHTLEVPLDDMRRVMDTNFWGTVHGSRVACELLRARGGGALINVGSVLSERAVPLQGIYSASKHAIKGWTDSLRTELMHDGAPISVTLIEPGPIDTPYAEHAGKYLPDQPVHLPPVYAPESVAEAILYAAEHPRRQIYVGSTARLLPVLDRLWPRLVDRLMASVLMPFTHSGRPRQGRESLWQPSESLRERGDYPGIVHRSVYTWLTIHPRAIATVGIGTAAAIALWRLTADRPPDSADRLL